MKYIKSIATSLMFYAIAYLGYEYDVILLKFLFGLIMTVGIFLGAVLLFAKESMFKIKENLKEGNYKKEDFSTKTMLWVYFHVPISFFIYASILIPHHAYNMLTWVFLGQIMCLMGIVRLRKLLMKNIGCLNATQN